MKTIVVDHDSQTEIQGQQRFNKIILLLRTYGAENLYTEWADITLDAGIITPREIQRYLDTDYKIIYALTVRTPGPHSHGEEAWLRELTTEIPDNIIELANQGKLHIAYFVGEILTMKVDAVLEEVNKQLHFAGIKKEAITVYIPNYKIDELDVSHIKFVSIFELSYNFYLNNQSKIPINRNIIQTVNLAKRNKKFTCLNHLNKTHRLCFSASLFNAGKHTDGYFSYHNKSLVEGEPSRYVTTINANNFLGHVPFLIDTEGSKEVNYHDTVLKPFFNDAYWNFATESFYADYYALTEKTFKPIVNLQPFIVVGAPHSLEALHKLGYETFSSVIDESYDYTEDHDRRMELLVEVALRLINMSDEQHIKIMTKIKPILEHNQRVFFSKHWKDMI